MMFPIILILCLIIIFNTIVAETTKSNDCFIAAVFEYIPFGVNTDLDPNVIIKINLLSYELAVVDAKIYGSNIIVFPEDGIIMPAFMTRSKVSSFTESIPEPENGSTHNPCEQSAEYVDRPTLVRLSCMAKNSSIYIVANMGDKVACSPQTDSECPEDHHYLYNTAVAFDPNGYLVAKYHKMQLYYEPFNNIPPEPELIYFDTPFGRMGLFICFDMLFKVPGTELVSKYNVTTMVFPTWWFDELPLISAVEMQQSWAITNKVNLLASNVHQIMNGTVGSGIYSGENGAIIYTNSLGDYSTLIMANIPIDSRDKNSGCLVNGLIKKVQTKSQTKSSTGYEHNNMDLEGFALLRLVKQTDFIDLCNNGFCCQLNYTTNQTLKDESYWFMVKNQTGYALTQKQYPICEEICVIVKCNSSGNSVCESFQRNANIGFENIEISAKFSTNYSYPSVTSDDLSLVPKAFWKYENDGQIGSEVRLSVNGFEKAILSVGLYGRCYQRDPPYQQLPDADGSSGQLTGQNSILITMFTTILLIIYQF